jgi:hypothetical protein
VTANSLQVNVIIQVLCHSECQEREIEWKKDFGYLHFLSVLGPPSFMTLSNLQQNDPQLCCFTDSTPDPSVSGWWIGSALSIVGEGGMGVSYTSRRFLNNL